LYRSSEGRAIADIARELGIGTETFRKWIRQDEADRGERDDRLTCRETEELRRLRKENAELKRTNEILRLASAFFAQEADPTRRRSCRLWKRIVTPSGLRRFSRPTQPRVVPHRCD
jgi:transposase